jgi:hypothetical protein
MVSTQRLTFKLGRYPNSHILCFLVTVRLNPGSTLGHLRSPYRLVAVTAGRRWSEEMAPPGDSGGHLEALRLGATLPQGSASCRRA